MAMPFYLAGYYGKNYLNNRAVSYYYLIPAFICLATTILLSRWNVSRDDARRYIARRSKEAAAIRRKHQERLRKLHNVPEFLD